MNGIKEYNYFYPGTNISVKDIQKIELEILDELDRICKLKQIPYQLAYGTLLGAVRHKGFIPWDDDIDVFMERNDYERFLQEGAPELGNEYFLQTCYTDPNTVIQFAKIRKKGTIYAERSDSASVICNGIWVDIFPLDHVRPGTLADWYQRLRIAIYYGIITSSVKNRIKSCQSVSKKCLRFVFSGLLRIIPKRMFDKRFQSVVRKYSSGETGYLAHLTNGISSGMQHSYIVPSGDYYHMTKLEFCKRMYPVPEDYDHVLTILYGDYMRLPQEEKRYPMHEGLKVEI